MHYIVIEKMLMAFFIARRAEVRFFYKNRTGEACYAIKLKMTHFRGCVAFCALASIIAPAIVYIIPFLGFYLYYSHGRLAPSTLRGIKTSKQCE